jgi:hypothetical protein
VVKVVISGDGGRVSFLPRVNVWRLEAVLVALTANRLDTALQRCPPQHRRMIQKRAPCLFSGFKTHMAIFLNL